MCRDFSVQLLDWCECVMKMNEIAERVSRLYVIKAYVNYFVRVTISSSWFMIHVVSILALHSSNVYT